MADRPDIEALTAKYAGSGNVTGFLREAASAGASLTGVSALAKPQGQKERAQVRPLSTSGPLEIPAGATTECPSYTPVHTRLGVEVARALGIDPTKVLKASLEFPEHGFTTMTVQLFVTEEQMRAALAAVAATEARQQP